VNREAARSLAAASACTFLAAVFLLFIARDLRRDPNVDEVEYLHTALRMDRGERIFTDFSQHHSPLFFAMLMPFAPAENGVAAMRDYVIRARLLMFACALTAILAMTLLVWRASGRVHAPIMAAALVLGAEGLWANGLGDVRAESPGLACWWVGAVLVLLARRGGWRGLGLGLIFVANLINPKWPVESVAVGVLFLLDTFRDSRALVEATVVSTLTAAAGIGALALMTDLQLVSVHVVKMAVVLRDSLTNIEGVETLFPPFARAPGLLRPAAFVPAFAVVALGWIKARHTFAAPKLVAALAAVAAATLLELRFVYTWPVLDYRWYAFWALAGAAVMALAPQCAEALLLPFVRRARPLVRAVPAMLTALVIVAAVEVLPAPHVPVYWRRAAWIEARLAPGDTVWLDRHRHPLGAPDSSYYWFGFWDVIPSSLRFVAKSADARRWFPPLGDADLPPCRIERGLDRTTRFIEPPHYRTRQALDCFGRLTARGIIVRTPLPQVWMVRR